MGVNQTTTLLDRTVADLRQERAPFRLSPGRQEKHKLFVGLSMKDLFTLARASIPQDVSREHLETENTNVVLPNRTGDCMGSGHSA